MRKTFAIILAMLLTMTISVCGFAEDLEKTKCREYTSFFDADELTRVLDDVKDDTFTAETNGKEQQNGQSGEESLPYKVYYVTKEDFIYRLADGEKLTDMISSEYSWVFPGKYTVSYAGISEENKWHMDEYVEYTQEILDEGIVQKNTVDDNAVNAAIAGISAEVEDVICVTATAYRTDFVCIVTSKETYLVPFGKRPDFTGLTNGVVYSPEEVSEILLQNTDEIVYEAPNEDELLVGGFGIRLYRPKNNKVNLFIVIFPMVAAVAAAIPVVIVVQAKKHKSI